MFILNKLINFPVAIAKRIHLFPYRTQKLSSYTLIVLGGQLPGRVSSRRISILSLNHLIRTFLLSKFNIDVIRHLSVSFLFILLWLWGLAHYRPFRLCYDVGQRVANVVGATYQVPMDVFRFHISVVIATSQMQTFFRTLRWCNLLSTDEVCSGFIS